MYMRIYTDTFSAHTGRAIKINTTDMYMARARAQFKINTHGCCSFQLYNAASAPPLELCFYTASVAWNERAGQLARRVSQMRSPLAACREPTGNYNRQLDVLYVFEHSPQYILIHAPYTHIAVFRHISNMPLQISWSQLYYNTPMFCIAAIFVKYCSTTVSWLLLRMR